MKVFIVILLMVLPAKLIFAQDENRNKRVSYSIEIRYLKHVDISTGNSAVTVDSKTAFGKQRG